MKCVDNYGIIEIKEFPKYPDDINKVFGNLIVLYEIESADTHSEIYMIRCKCGKEFLQYRSNLYGNEYTSKRRGIKQTCGCGRSKPLSKPRKCKHGDGKTRNKKKLNRLYKIWTGMRERCNRPNAENYHLYGGRGITVCKEWDDYTVFKKWAIKNGYEKGLSIDRINADLGYNPKNCRWVTMKEQQRNKRSNSRFLINGEWILQVDLAKKLGVCNTTVKKMATDGRLKYEKWLGGYTQKAKKK